MLADASLDAEASSSTEFSENSSNHSGRSCDQLPNAASMSSLFFLFSILWNLATGLPVLDWTSWGCWNWRGIICR